MTKHLCSKCGSQVEKNEFDSFSGICVDCREPETNLSRYRKEEALSEFVCDICNKEIGELEYQENLALCKSCADREAIK